MNDNHLRAINSILRYVEMRLVDEWFKLTNDEVRELHYIKDDFTSREKTKNLLIIESLLEEIREAKDLFGLQEEETSLRREVEATLIGVKVTLDGLRPKSLVNYGELEKDDKTQLNHIYLNFLKDI